MLVDVHEAGLGDLPLGFGRLKQLLFIDAVCSCSPQATNQPGCLSQVCLVDGSQLISRFIEYVCLVGQITYV